MLIEFECSNKKYQKLTKIADEHNTDVDGVINMALEDFLNSYDSIYDVL